MLLQETGKVGLDMKSFRQEAFDADLRNAILAPHLDGADCLVMDEGIRFVSSNAQNFGDFTNGICGWDNVIRHGECLLLLRTAATVEPGMVIALELLADTP